MVINNPRFRICSQNSNQTYWEQDVFPEWTALSCYRHFPAGQPGQGVEPHYHDNDEIWLFTEGRGEVWLDEVKYDITPNTLVYTPMGCVHRFQMFTSYENNAIVTRLEREKRPLHLLVDEHGPPEPTVPGFVVPGVENTGPVPDPGDRCPVSEWRLLSYDDVKDQDMAELLTNEHWMVLSGTLHMVVDGWDLTLEQEDMALLRAGTARIVYAEDNEVRAVIVREKRR